MEPRLLGRGEGVAPQGSMMRGTLPYLCGLCGVWPTRYLHAPTSHNQLMHAFYPMMCVFCWTDKTEPEPRHRHEGSSTIVHSAECVCKGQNPIHLSSSYSLYMQHIPILSSQLSVEHQSSCSSSVTRNCIIQVIISLSIRNSV